MYADDSRLKPRRTKLLVAIFSLVTLAIAAAVFCLVPRRARTSGGPPPQVLVDWHRPPHTRNLLPARRGVSVGSVVVETRTMSWNKTSSTYQLQLRINMSSERAPPARRHNPPLACPARTKAPSLGKLFARSQQPELFPGEDGGPALGPLLRGGGRAPHDPGCIREPRCRSPDLCSAGRWCALR